MSNPDLSLKKKIFIKSIGVLMMGVGAFLLLSLLSFHASDPSMNNATDLLTHNIMGSTGAYAADLILQFFGIAGLLVALVFPLWGWKIFSKNSASLLWLKLTFLLICLPASATLFSFVSTVESWPFTSMGGIIGAFVSEELSYSVSHYVVLGGAAALTTLSLFVALGLNTKEWHAVGRFSFKMLRYIVRTIRFLLYYAYRGVLWVVCSFKRKEEMAIKPPPKKIIDMKAKKKAAEKKKPAKVKQASLNLTPEDFELPPCNLLESPSGKDKKHQLSAEALDKNARLLEKVLDDFGVRGEITQIRPGPVVTLYELEPAPGTKSSRVIGLADDIARSMSAVSVRIAVVPGRNAIGIELPNNHREMVLLRELVESPEYKDEATKLPVGLGKDIGGDAITVDLARMPHLLVAGTTGSGKSVFINAMILSLIYRMTPNECRFIMIDPKMLELSVYDGIPHLLTPVVTEPGKAVVALKWAVREMENRYRLMSNLGVRNISGYNKRVREAMDKGEVLEKTVQTGFEPETGKPIYEKVPLDMSPLPFIVVIVDEMADLMLVAGKDIEASIQRLAQMARAAGIHIVMATQRPSVDVITGVIKANFPTRISFQVTSRIDSRTILGEQGAEQLLGMGDMLYMAGGTRITRVHGAFVDDKEVENVVKYLKTQGAPEYIEEVTVDDGSSISPDGGGMGTDEEMSLYDQAVAIVIRDQKASTSYIQRQLKIGYNRAADLIDQMESQGVISQANHVGKREVLVENREEV